MYKIGNFQVPTEMQKSFVSISVTLTSKALRLRHKLTVREKIKHDFSPELFEDKAEQISVEFAFVLSYVDTYALHFTAFLCFVFR